MGIIKPKLTLAKDFAPFVYGHSLLEESKKLPNDEEVSTIASILFELSKDEEIRESAWARAARYEGISGRIL